MMAVESLWSPPPMTDPESRKRSLADPGFKKLFSHPRMAELVVRKHFPEWVGRLDFSTLESAPTELITDRLAQRYADLVWRGVSKDGTSDFLLMMEFQDRPDPQMALRTAVYAGLAAKDLLDKQVHRGEAARPLTVESLVLHHGGGDWTAPTRVANLLDGSGLAGHRLVSWRQAGAGRPERLDLPAMTLGLGVWKALGLRSELRRLRVLVQRFGDESFDRFVAWYMTAILDSRDIPRDQLEEPITMETAVRAFDNGLADFARKHREEGEREGREQGEREGREQGRREGEVRMLRRLVAHRFGSAAEERLARVLATPVGSERMRLLENAVLECDSSVDFLGRAREVAERR